MGKIVLDRRGDLRRGVFYGFDVPFNDNTDGLRPDPDWIIMPRTPTDDSLRAKGQEPYRYIKPWTAEEDIIEIKDCPADSTHVTHAYSRKLSGDAFGGERVSPLVPMDILDKFALSDELYRRVQKLKLRGARLDAINLIVNPTEEKLPGFWSLQFVGRAALRIPKFVDAPNACPFCGKGKIGCESCGKWSPYCTVCRKDVATIKEEHGGKEDKRLSIQEQPWRILEGKTWDGSDLIQACGRIFSSKRFIDWLLRIHAAPFYAEPVWFCVDGMNGDQKQWFDELKKPLEAG